MKTDVREDIVVPTRIFRAGASYGACNYFTESRFTRHFEWIHGWRPTWFDGFADEGIGCISKSKVYGVADENHRAIIRNMGADALTVGLPFAYELDNYSENLIRIPNSCLYLPPHITHENGHYESRHVEAIKQTLAKYERVTICLHWASYQNVSVRDSYQKYGWTVIEGANNNDENSLKRMLFLFVQHEVLIVDYYGSHIAYAAACGMDLVFTSENTSRIPNDCKGMSMRFADKYRELTCLDYIKAQFYTHKNRGVSSVAWGLNEIGFQYVNLTKLRNVKRMGVISSISRVTGKISRLLVGEYRAGKRQSYRDQMATFVIEKTLCDQRIVTFDFDIAERINQLGKQCTWLGNKLILECRCSNFVSHTQCDLAEYGTIVAEYCDKCVGKVLEYMKMTSLSAKYILYKHVQSSDSISQLLPHELSATVFDTRILQADFEVSKPAVNFCFICVVGGYA